MQLSTNVSPVQIVMLIVSVMSLTIDRALPVTLLSIRQQLVEAKKGPLMLACTSTAPQLNLAGWA